MSTPLDGFQVFVAVCEAESISGGARALGVPRATVSRQLARLEADLGVRLLHRSTRQLTRTPAGDELYGRARRIVADALAARVAVARTDGVPRGLLRVSVPGELRGRLGDILIDFLERYPEVQLEVAAASRYVDLVAEGFDVALRAGSLAESSLVARKLVSTTLDAWASPAYLEAHGRPASLEDLASHACIRIFDRGSIPQTHWPLRDGGKVPISGRLAANSLGIVEKAVLAGQGIGMLPWRPEGAEPVLPELLGVVNQLQVVYPERKLLPPKVRAFVDHLVEHAADLVPVGV